MTARKLKFESILLPQGWARDVCVSINHNGVIAEIGSGEGERVCGIAVAGMANVHSHAHQRFMQGLAERAGPGADSFWTWREVMYGFALKLSPDDLQAVAAQAYMEMVLAGFTGVGEFQYLHHQPDGTAYDNRAEMSLRCLAASEEVGIGITMLPVFYRYGGFGGQAPSASQRRFINNVDGFLDIKSKLPGGIAPHSLRAVTKDDLNAVLNAVGHKGPIHIHVAEQVKEIEDCLAWCGQRPVDYMLNNFAVQHNWCAIHATHMVETEIQRLAASGAVVGLCPSTEANLGDGTFPAVSFLKASGTIGIGSDSHITISPAEDLRQLEYSQRLQMLTRNALADGPGQSTGRSLFTRSLVGGANALQQNMGSIEIGKRADIVVLDGGHNALLGRTQDEALDSWIFSGGNACVRDVYIAGKHVVKDRCHVNQTRIVTNFKKALDRISHD
jgi:formimidoylglutamate deiminase